MCRRTEEEVGPTVGLQTPLTFRRVLIRSEVNVMWRFFFLSELNNIGEKFRKPCPTCHKRVLYLKKFFLLNYFEFGLLLLLLFIVYRHIERYCSYICNGTKMCRRIEEVGPTVGLPCHRHLVGVLNVPVQALTQGQTFLRLFWETAPFQSLFPDAHEDTEDYFSSQLGWGMNSNT